jgi:hypothetical protein
VKATIVVISHLGGREGGNLSFTLALTKSSKNSVDVKKDWVTRKLLMGLGIVCRV